MRENDIYRWHWKEGCRPIVGCYAHLAICHSGKLRDTYWHDWAVASCIDVEKVDMTLLGNVDDCDVIRVWDIPYYDPADIIDMNHRNNSNGPIYLKKGARKSQEWMLARAEEKETQARRDMESAERSIVYWAERVAKIKAGDLEVQI